jgi:hypothetical protein
MLDLPFANHQFSVRALLHNPAAAQCRSALNRNRYSAARAVVQKLKVTARVLSTTDALTATCATRSQRRRGSRRCD